MASSVSPIIERIRTRRALPVARLAQIGLMLSLLIVDAVWLALSDLRFDSSRQNLTMLLPPAAPLVIAWFYIRVRPSERISNLALDLSALIYFAYLAVVFSYLVAASGGALRDDWMIFIDRKLGFDWLQYGKFLLRDDALRQAARIAYQITPLLVIVTIAWLSLSGKTYRSREFVLLIMISGVLCIGTSGLIPTAGAVGYFKPGSDFYNGARVMVDSAYLETFHMLRDGSLQFVSLLDSKGLVAFPSYHTCLAALIILAFRDGGPWLWIMAPLNVATIAATPLQGGHHLSDVLGGLATVALAFLMVRWLFAERDVIADD